MKTPIRLLLTLALSAGASLAQDDRRPASPDAPPNQPPQAGAPGERRGDAPRDGDRRPDARGPRDGSRGNQPQADSRRAEGAPQGRDFNGPRDGGERQPQARGLRDGNRGNQPQADGRRAEGAPQGRDFNGRRDGNRGEQSQPEGRRPEGMPQRPDFNGPRDRGPRPEGRGPRDQGQQNQRAGDRRRGPQPGDEARNRGSQGGANSGFAHRGFGQRFQHGRAMMEQRFGMQGPDALRGGAPQMQGGERGNFRGPGPMNAGPRPNFDRPPFPPRGGSFNPRGPRHFQPDGLPPGPPMPPPFQ